MVAYIFGEERLHPRGSSRTCRDRPVIPCREGLDLDARSTEAALEALKVHGSKGKLVKLAVWRPQSEQDAEDLVQAAVAMALYPDDSPWISTDNVPFFMHTRSIDNGPSLDELASQSMRREIPDASVAETNTVSPASHPDEAPEAH